MVQGLDASRDRPVAPALRALKLGDLLVAVAADGLPAHRIRPAARRFAVAAAPLKVGAVVLLVLLALVVPASSGLGGLLGIYLVLISALTVPHAVVVALMDRTQGIWKRSESHRGARAPIDRAQLGERLRK